jgi:hypothetical protein
MTGVDNSKRAHSSPRGDSLREIPFSHGAYFCDNEGRERSIIQFSDLLSHWLSLRVIRGTDSSGKQFLDKEFIFYICSAQTRTGMGHLRKPPGVELIPAVD